MNQGYTIAFDKITLTKKGWKCKVYQYPKVKGEAIYTTIIDRSLWDVYNKLREISRENTMVTKF